MVDVDPISPCETLRPFQRIPNELWIKVLGQIPRSDLANVNLTSRSLLSVSRTLQFEAFTFHPYDIDYSTVPQRLMQSDDEVNAAIQRLEFWASPTISFLVRQINISPWLGEANDLHPISADPDRDNRIRETLVNAFFQRLRHFVNLQKLDCYQLDFNHSALQHLSQLPLLKVLVVERCSISASEAPSTPFRLARMEYTDALAGYDRLQTSGVQRWLTFLDPSCLQSLRLIPARVATVFFRDISAVGVMSSLHTLDIGLLVAPLHQIISVLSKTPVLKILRMSALGVPHSQYQIQSPQNNLSFSSSPVPLLSQYRGPHELLHIIQPGRLLRCLELFGFDRGCSNIGPLLESLRPFRDTMVHVESLDLSLRDVSETTFSALFPMFVGLKSLHLLVSDNDGSDLRESLFNISPRTPPNATSLRVEPEFIKNKIFSEFPALQHLWLQCGRRFEMFWMRPENGPEVLEERKGLLDFKQRRELQRMFADDNFI